MRLPNDSQRLNIYGKTGSGKTVAGLWHLEKRAIHRRPWVIVDFKREPTIARIPRLEEIDIDARIPKQPGLYVVRPFPDDEYRVTEFFWRVWTKGNTGLFLDEAFMVGRFNKAYDAIMTQGRSIRIPVIALSQRPAWLSRFQMSEADFHQVMFIQNPADVQRIEQWVPGLGPLSQDFHSYYYDVSKNTLDHLSPVPDEEEILNRFDATMPRRIKLFSGLFTSPADTRRKRLTA